MRANLSKESHYSSLNVEPHWYVDDGCHTECRIVNGKPHCIDGIDDDYIGTFQPNSFGAGVRCCSNDGKTCKTQKGACPGDSTYSEAFEKCSDIGMRLCTKAELLTEMCCKTGGWCDSHPVWTSTTEQSMLIRMMLDLDISTSNIFFYLRY